LPSASADNTEAALQRAVQGSPGALDYVEHSRNYTEHGRPCYHRFSRNGGFERGETGVKSFKGSRESDSLILVMKPAKVVYTAE